MKKITSGLLCLCMLCSLFSFSVLAEIADTISDFERDCIDILSDTADEEYFSTIKLEIGNTTMTVDGKEQEIDAGNNTAPIIEEDKTLVPVRKIAELRGAEVEYDEEIEAVHITQEDKTLQFRLGEKSFQVNDEEKTLDVAPVLKEDRTYLPLRDVAESLDCEVKWNEEEQSITLSAPTQTKRIIAQGNAQSANQLNDIARKARKSTKSDDYLYVMQFSTEGETKQAFEEINRLSNVEFCEYDTPMKADALSWGVAALESDKFISHLEKSGNTSEVIVAVLDSGINTSHIFLRDRIYHTGYNFADGGSINDREGHGTHVAGIVADNTPNNVKIMPVKVLNDQGSGSALPIKMGIDFAVKNGADVINMSLGGYGAIEMITRAINNAVSNGVTVVVAAGNESDNANDYSPAGVRNAITVAAVDQNNRPAPFSNYGSCVDVAAPGVDINSSYAGGGYQMASGTSMASPFVAGLAAMLKLQDNSRTPHEIENLLKNNVTPLSNTAYGTGVPKMSKLINNRVTPNEPSISLPDPDPTYSPDPEPYEPYEPEEPVYTPAPTPSYPRDEPVQTKPSRPSAPSRKSGIDWKLIDKYLPHYQDIIDSVNEIVEKVENEMRKGQYANQYNLENLKSSLEIEEENLFDLSINVSEEYTSDTMSQADIEEIFSQTDMAVQHTMVAIGSFIQGINGVNSEISLGAADMSLGFAQSEFTKAKATYNRLKIRIGI